MYRGGTVRPRLGNRVNTQGFLIVFQSHLEIHQAGLKKRTNYQLAIIYLFALTQAGPSFSQTVVHEMFKPAAV